MDTDYPGHCSGDWLPIDRTLLNLLRRFSMPTSANLTATRVLAAIGLVFAASFLGCGTTREREATQQLVLSSAVDRSISGIDFRPLSGRKVYLDTSYLRQIKGSGFVNADYITSALRQQIAAAGCLLQDTSQEADLIIEARVGALGADDHSVTFGMPENNTISTVASYLPNAPTLPAMPEISVGRRDAREGAVRIAAFAYDRESRKALWQSGVREANATARDTYVMGIGPFQGGTIRDGTKLAGSRTWWFGRKENPKAPVQQFDRPPVDYTAETRFQDGWPVLDKHVPSPNMLEAPHKNEAEQIAKNSDVGGDQTSKPVSVESKAVEKVANSDADAPKTEPAATKDAESPPPETKPRPVRIASPDQSAPKH